MLEAGVPRTALLIVGTEGGALLLLNKGTALLLLEAAPVDLGLGRSLSSEWSFGWEALECVALGLG